MMKPIAFVAGGILIAYLAIAYLDLPFPGRYQALGNEMNRIVFDTWTGDRWVGDTKEWAVFRRGKPEIERMK